MIWVSIPMLLAIRLLLITLGLALFYFWYKGRLSSVAGLLLILLCVAGIWGVSNEINKINENPFDTSTPLGGDATTSMSENRSPLIISFPKYSPNLCLRQ